MPRIFTYPDVDTNPNIPKVLISYADWSDDFIMELINSLSFKEYDIYLLNNKVTDVQWEYGIKDKCKTKLDARDAGDDILSWLLKFDESFIG